MKSSKKNNPKFSLKDELFNKKTLEKIALEIKSISSKFEDKKFINYNLQQFPKLELKERIEHITGSFNTFISKDHKKTISLLLKSLPKELNPKLTDNDFGSFVYAPYSLYVAKYACNKKDLSFSLNALKEITKRFSAEDAIRYFLNAFPKESLLFLKKCAKDNHYHVRRLASEGSRPTLPWCQKINIDFKEPLEILNLLYKDKTRYVTRSVANHLNDVSKIDPKLVINILKKWKKENIQSKDELNFIIKHSLRTLINNGNKEALKLIGINEAKIKVSKFKVSKDKVKIGENIDFEFSIESNAKNTQNLLIDYILYFKKANGSHLGKTFKIKKTNIAPQESMKFFKKHQMKTMSTKTLYTGEHIIKLQINGSFYGEKSFNLTE